MLLLYLILGMHSMKKPTGTAVVPQHIIRAKQIQNDIVIKSGSIWLHDEYTDDSIAIPELEPIANTPVVTPVSSTRTVVQRLGELDPKDLQTSSNSRGGDNGEVLLSHTAKRRRTLDQKINALKNSPSPNRGSKTADFMTLYLTMNKEEKEAKEERQEREAKEAAIRQAKEDARLAAEHRERFEFQMALEKSRQEHEAKMALQQQQQLMLLMNIVKKG